MRAAGPITSQRIRELLTLGLLAERGVSSNPAVLKETLSRADEALRTFETRAQQVVDDMNAAHERLVRQVAAAHAAAS